MHLYRTSPPLGAQKLHPHNARPFKILKISANAYVLDLPDDLGKALPLMLKISHQDADDEFEEHIIALPPTTSSIDKIVDVLDSQIISTR